MLDHLEERAATGDRAAITLLALVTRQLEVLQDLSAAPVDDLPSLRRVRQSRRYQVWRLSHPYRPEHAVRTIVWFPDGRHAVVALFANDKAQMGDVFYDSVGTRADQIIDRWIRERREKP